MLHLREINGEKRKNREGKKGEKKSKKGEDSKYDEVKDRLKAEVRHIKDERRKIHGGKDEEVV